MRLPTLLLWSVIAMIIFSGNAWSNTDLPYEFDSLVPVYAAAQPIDTRYTRDSVAVSFATQDSFDRVLDFYAQVLKEAGWQISKADAGKSLLATNNTIELTLTEKGDRHGFSILLFYRGGRE